MKTVQWSPGLVFELDPQAVEDYRFNFTDWLDGETLAGAVVTALEFSAVLQTFTPEGLVNFRVSSGIEGTASPVTVSVTSSTGRVTERSISIHFIQM